MPPIIRTPILPFAGEDLELLREIAFSWTPEKIRERKLTFSHKPEVLENATRFFERVAASGDPIEPTRGEAEALLEVLPGLSRKYGEGDAKQARINRLWAPMLEMDPQVVRESERQKALDPLLEAFRVSLNRCTRSLGWHGRTYATTNYFRPLLGFPGVYSSSDANVRLEYDAEGFHLKGRPPSGIVWFLDFSKEDFIQLAVDGLEDDQWIASNVGSIFHTGLHLEGKKIVFLAYATAPGGERQIKGWEIKRNPWVSASKIDNLLKFFGGSFLYRYPRIESLSVHAGWILEHATTLVALKRNIEFASWEEYPELEQKIRAIQDAVAAYQHAYRGESADQQLRFVDNWLQKSVPLLREKERAGFTGLGHAVEDSLSGIAPNWHVTEYNDGDTHYRRFTYLIKIFKALSLDAEAKLLEEELEVWVRDFGSRNRMLGILIEIARLETTIQFRRTEGEPDIPSESARIAELKDELYPRNLQPDSRTSRPPNTRLPKPMLLESAESLASQSSVSETGNSPSDETPTSRLGDSTHPENPLRTGFIHFFPNPSSSAVPVSEAANLGAKRRIRRTSRGTRVVDGHIHRQLAKSGMRRSAPRFIPRVFSTTRIVPMAAWAASAPAAAAIRPLALVKG